MGANGIKISFDVFLSWVKNVLEELRQEPGRNPRQELGETQFGFEERDEGQPMLRVVSESAPLEVVY